MIASDQIVWQRTLFSDNKEKGLIDSAQYRKLKFGGGVVKIVTIIIIIT